MLRLLIRKARSLWRQPVFVRAWLIPVWFLLGIAKALIFALTFKRMFPWFGDKAGIQPMRPLIAPSQIAGARQIGRVIRMAARYTPWDSNCYPQAIVARLLLGIYRIPYALCFGVMRDSAVPGMQAHAWVTAGSVNEKSLSIHVMPFFTLLKS